jgi:hypothetical protein
LQRELINIGELEEKIMLKMMRDFASSWWLKAILILVVLSFVMFFGGYSYFKGKNVTYVAKVNSVTIEWREYNDAFQNTIKQYQQAFGPAFSEKMIDELRLKDKVLDEPSPRFSSFRRQKIGVSFLMKN